MDGFEDYQSQNQMKAKNNPSFYHYQHKLTGSKQKSKKKSYVLPAYVMRGGITITQTLYITPRMLSEHLLIDGYSENSTNSRTTVYFCVDNQCKLANQTSQTLGTAHKMHIFSLLVR